MISSLIITFQAKKYLSFPFAEFEKMVHDSEASILRGREFLPALENSLLHR